MTDWRHLSKWTWRNLIKRHLEIAGELSFVANYVSQSPTNLNKPKLVVRLCPNWWNLLSQPNSDFSEFGSLPLINWLNAMSGVEGDPAGRHPEHSAKGVRDRDVFKWRNPYLPLVNNINNYILYLFGLIRRNLIAFPSQSLTTFNKLLK